MGRGSDDELGERGGRFRMTSEYDLMCPLRLALLEGFSVSLDTSGADDWDDTDLPVGICARGVVLTSPERLGELTAFGFDGRGGGDESELDLDLTMYVDTSDTPLSVLRRLLPRPKLALPSLRRRDRPEAGDEGE